MNKPAKMYFRILTRFAGSRARRILLTLMLSGLMLFAIFKSLLHSPQISEVRSWRLAAMLSQSKEHSACSLPKLNLGNPLIDKYFHDVPPLECSKSENWVCVKDGYAKLCDFAASRPNGTVNCVYKFIDRIDDHNNHVTVTIDSSAPVKLATDFFHVSCTYTSGNRVTKTWKNLMCGIADRGKDTTKSRPFPSTSMGYNVLILGFDSLSHMTYRRKLSKTYQYLTKTLNAVVLDGYNIVGDGTPQALIPIFTGMTELELPETRKRMGNRANFVNVYPFAWNDYSENDFVTGYAEDGAQIGTFTYRLKGFDKPPTDHYGRPFYLELNKIQSEHYQFCLAATPRHQVFFNYIEQFFDHYVNRPKFYFGFHSELSHDDYNLVGLVDNDLVSFLKLMKSKGHLDNTILVMMSDHGHRFADIRETQQGKQEERLPFFSFVFPPDFQKKYPKEWANIHENVDKLTSPFDIYPTLKDILYYRGSESLTGEADHTKKKLFNRSISLFQKIPATRTCEDAGIEPHWCTCLQNEPVPLDDPIVNKVAAAFINYVNNLTLPQKSLCHELHLEQVDRLEKHVPRTDLLKYKKNSDYDGFVGDFTDDTKVTDVIYHIKLTTNPGNGHFEASISHDLRKDSFLTSERSISRVNAYGTTSHCIAQTQHHLLKYCYCREQLNSNSP